MTGVELATHRVPGAERDRSGEPNLAQEMEDGGGWVALLALVAVVVLAVVRFSVAGCTRAVDRAQRRRDAGKHLWPYGLAAAPLVLASALVTLGWVAASPPQ